MEIKNAVNKALDDMPDDFSIKSYLTANRDTVVAMCIEQYNEEKRRALAKKEGITIGAVRQLVGAIKDGLISEEDATRRADMSLSDFKRCVATYCS